MVHVFQLLVFAADKRQCPCPSASVARIDAFINDIQASLALAQ